MRKSDLDLKLIRRIHKVLLTGVRGEGKKPGSVRSTQNHIGYRGEPIEKAIFIPPTPDALLGAIPEFESFLAGTQRDVIVQISEGAGYNLTQRHQDHTYQPNRSPVVTQQLPSDA